MLLYERNALDKQGIKMAGSMKSSDGRDCRTSSQELYKLSYRVLVQVFQIGELNHDNDKGKKASARVNTNPLLLGHIVP